MEIYIYDFSCVSHWDLHTKAMSSSFTIFSQGIFFHRNVEIVDYHKCYLMGLHNEEFTITPLFLRIPICMAFSWTTSNHTAIEDVSFLMIIFGETSLLNNSLCNHGLLHMYFPFSWVARVRGPRFLQSESAVLVRFP